MPKVGPALGVWGQQQQRQMCVSAVTPQSVCAVSVPPHRLSGPLQASNSTSGTKDGSPPACRQSGARESSHGCCELPPQTVRECSPSRQRQQRQQRLRHGRRPGGCKPHSRWVSGICLASEQSCAGGRVSLALSPACLHHRAQDCGALLPSAGFPRPRHSCGPSPLAGSALTAIINAINGSRKGSP